MSEREVEITRDMLVRYAAASGDFNPIHYNDAFAQKVGLPGVIAHGMLTMGIGASVVEEWAGAGNIADYQARFTPSRAGAGTRGRHCQRDRSRRRARPRTAARAHRRDGRLRGSKVLGKAQAMVDCA